MANNYTQFSAAVTQLSPDEEEWLTAQLTKIYVIDGKEYPQDDVPEDVDPAEADWDGPRFLRGMDDDCDDMVGFDYEFLTDGPDPHGDGQGRYLWIYADESGDASHVVILVQKFLAKFRPRDHWWFSFATVCSEMREDEFGGDRCLVTATTLLWATDMLRRHARRLGIER